MSYYNIQSRGFKLCYIEAFNLKKKNHPQKGFPVITTLNIFIPEILFWKLKDLKIFEMVGLMI